MSYTLPTSDQADFELQGAGYIFPGAASASFAYFAPPFFGVAGETGVSTMVGSPRVVSIVSASSFGSEKLGRPLAFRQIQAVTNRAFSASANNTTVFGLASASTSVSLQAAGAAFGVLGAASSGRAIGATSASGATSFGLPSAQVGTFAFGVRATGFGIATAARIQAAASLYRAPRFGSPVAASQYDHLASSLSPTVLFGGPTYAQRYQARHLAPEPRFGKPLMIRNPPC